MSFLLDPFGSPFMQRALLEAVLLGVIGAVVSVFVVLRRLAFVSDVLTHTVFPGVVIGFLVAGTGGIVWGALAFAVLSAVLLTVLGARARVTEDASMAIVLTAFFALGVILVSRRSSFTTDLTAFLFGRILTVDRTQILVTAGIGAAVVLTLGLLGKELLLRAFDPAGAEARGYRVLVLDLVLNLAVALVVVAAVRAVGTVLVIALLVVPGAAGRLLSDRLAGITVAAVVVAALAGWLGLVASWQASVNHGLRLASGATVVLVLVALYGIAAGLAAVRDARERSRRGRAATGADRPAPAARAEERAR
jgi:manganese/iron transport system permease protein